MLITTILFFAGCEKNLDNNGKFEVLTSEVSDITGNSAIGGGVIMVSETGVEITERGLCWDTQPNPDVSGTYSIAGLGIGTFTCKIKNLEPNTTYHVRAYALNGVNVQYGEDRSFVTKNIYNGHECVDLGLPSGTLWATCNVGGVSPQSNGYYFAWGETEPKSNYSWDTYRYCNGGPSEITKYCCDSWGESVVDNLTELQPCDDAATINWGNGWRTPTKEEWEELWENTSPAHGSSNGVSYTIFRAVNGNELVMSDAGSYSGTVFSEGIYYWSCTLNGTYTPLSAWGFSYYALHHMTTPSRSSGLPVRPVRSAK